MVAFYLTVLDLDYLHINRLYIMVQQKPFFLSGFFDTSMNCSKGQQTRPITTYPSETHISRFGSAISHEVRFKLRTQKRGIQSKETHAEA